MIISIFNCLLQVFPVSPHVPFRDVPFMLLPFILNLHVQLVLPKSAWVWGHQSTGALPVLMLPRKSYSPSLSLSAVRTPYPGWSITSPTSPYLCWSAVWLDPAPVTPSCCEFMSATVTSCPEDSISQHRSIFQLLRSSHVPFRDVPWTSGRDTVDTDVLSMAEHPLLTFSSFFD